MKSIDPDSNDRQLLSRFTPAAITVALGLIISFALWTKLADDEARLYHHDVIAQAREINDTLELLLNFQVNALKRLGHRWVIDGGTPVREWTADADDYLVDMPQIRGVEWLDPAGIVRRVAPQKERAEFWASTWPPIPIEVHPCVPHRPGTAWSRRRC